MKTLIVYDTEYGCTKKVSEKMKDTLGDEVTFVNLKKLPNPELNIFDRIIIGGSSHAGKIHKRVKEFCYRNLSELKDKELGLFICCTEEGEAAHRQFVDAYPEELRFVAKSTAIFKGSFDFGSLNYFERLIAGNVAHKKRAFLKYDFEAVQRFSRRMDRVFNPFLFLA